MTTSKTFKMIDDEVAKGIPKGDDGFNLEKAGLYGIHEFADGGAIAIKESDNNDVYALLGNLDNMVKLIPYDGFGIVTVGWAAPLAKDLDDFDGPPSQHPEKRRVRLFCYCNAQGDVSSSIRFKDDDEVTYDENQATGSLKEAMTAMFKDKKDATKAFKAFQD